MRVRERNSVRMSSSDMLNVQSDTHIKKEEDSESNISGSMSGSVAGDVDVTMATIKDESSDAAPRYSIMTDHGQKSSASLLNMMMSVGGPASTRTLIAAKPTEDQENAMDLDLGLHGAGPSLTTHIGRNNGFGEIGSPALSPTASHTSTAARSISVEDDYDSPSGNG